MEKINQLLCKHILVINLPLRSFILLGSDKDINPFKYLKTHLYNNITKNRNFL